MLQKNQEERQKRQELKRQNKAATTIQLSFKAYLFKKKLFIDLRSDLDQNLNYLNNLKQINELDLKLFETIVRNFLFSYKQQTDVDKLTILSHFFIKHKDYICNSLIDSSSSCTKNDFSTKQSSSNQINQWLYRLKKLILLNLNNLFKLMFNDNVQQSNNFIPLQLLKIYTSTDFYLKNCKNQNVHKLIKSIWYYLIKNNYFMYMRKIIETKVPVPYDEDVSYTATERSIFELTIRPLNIEFNEQEDRPIMKQVIIEFFKQYLNGPFSPVIRFHVFKLINERLPNLLNFSCLANVLKELNSNPSSTNRSSEEQNFHSKKHTSLEQSNSNQIILPQNVWTLYALLSITQNQVENFSFNERLVYLFYIKNLIQYLPNQSKSTDEDESDEDEDEIMEDSSSHLDRSAIKLIASDSIELLNSIPNVNCLNNMFKLLNEDNIQELLSFSTIGYSILINNNRTSIYENRLLYTLAFNSNFLRQLWKYIITVTNESNTLLIQLICKGILLNEWKLILPHLSFFCSLFNYLLPTNDDFEFYEDKNSKDRTKFATMPFSLNELRSMGIILRDVSLGLIEMAYRDNKLSTDYRNAIQLEGFTTTEECVRHWSTLFKCVVTLLRQLHNRDSRHQFCPEKHWISDSVNISIEKPISFKIGQDQLDRFEKFVGLKKLSKKQLKELGPLMSTADIKNITILKEIPFVIPFTDRVRILQKLIEKDKQSNYGESHHFMIPGSTIDLVIRRNYIYEDAFEKLSFENEPDIKKHIRVQLKNAVGLEEAGIDGGGVGREFISELMKTAFDPNRGFFKSTNDRTLYPNPSAELLVDNYLTHYFFIGRIFGKAIYENMLNEIPFSHFFLAKLLTKNRGSDIDIHFLASLDPLMYKNLLYLKNYPGDVSELGLDFTVVQSDLGENKIVELKPNGKEIPVTVQNRIEYIHLMADYILNKQIRQHVSAFKQGLANCIDLDWIRMFNVRELQILISGAPTPIDLEDLKQNTTYSGGYSSNHLTIIAFWKAVESFNEKQKSLLLKFVTSCSRPPLLGNLFYQLA